MSLFKKVWLGPVWSSVNGLGGSYFLNWWPAIGRGTSAVFVFLGSKTPVWNWLLGLFVVAVLLAAVGLIHVISRCKGNAKKSLLHERQILQG